MRNALSISFLALLGAGTAAAGGNQHAEWLGTWAASPHVVAVQAPIGDSTFRNIVHISTGGTALRVVLANEFGKTPLLVGEAHLALSTGGGAIDPATDHAITFEHRGSVSIPPGAYVLSDPIAMQVAAFSNLAVSVYLQRQTVAVPTCHQYALSTNYIVSGDATADTTLPGARTQTSWCFLQAVDVQTEDKNAAAVVTLGDSITDGAHSTLDANHRYPDYLAERLHQNRKTAQLAVLNEGISGGRVLFAGHGPSALERFDRDVLAQPGVRYVIYLEGINDIGQILRPGSPEQSLTVSDLTGAAMQFVTRAHLQDVKVFGATLLPFGPRILPDNPNWTKVRETIEQYNQWVRTSHVFDGVVDFNKATADPSAPQTMLPAYDSGDHVHPNDAGYRAMANAVDLKAFSKP